MSTIIVDKSILPTIKRSIRVAKEQLVRQVRAGEKELERLESSHGMLTKDFVLRYRDGELGDDEEWIRWEFLWATHTALKETLLPFEQIRYQD